MNPQIRPYAWALGILWLLPLVLVLMGYLVLPGDVPPGECEGIGFGCSTSPEDTLALMVALASPGLLVLGLVAVGLIAWMQRRSRGK
jgi:hypothetical protein